MDNIFLDTIKELKDILLNKVEIIERETIFKDSYSIGCEQIAMLYNLNNSEIRVWFNIQCNPIFVSLITLDIASMNYISKIIICDVFYRDEKRIIYYGQDAIDKMKEDFKTQMSYDVEIKRRQIQLLIDSDNLPVC